MYFITGIISVPGLHLWQLPELGDHCAGPHVCMRVEPNIAEKLEDALCDDF